MTPYLQLRLWWRRAPYASKLASGTSVAIAVALVAWLLVPTGGDDTDVSAAAGATGNTLVAGGSGTAPVAAGGATPAGGATAAGGTPVATGGQAAGAAGAGGATGAPGAGGEPVAGSGGTGCLPTQGGVPGVDDGTITVAAAVLNLAGPIGNSAAGLAGPEDLKKMAQAVADDINANGGVQCRTLELRFYEANPINQDQQHSVCLQMAQDGPFLGIDLAGFATNNMQDCLPQQQIPFVAIQAALASELEQFQPYLATANSELGSAMRTAAIGLKGRGWFDPANGFAKIGILQDQCMPEANERFAAALAEVGVTSGQISTYEFPCPTTAGGFAPPNQMSQAVTQHRLDGVTNVVPLTGSGSFNTYTNIAQGQGFRPKYAFTDLGGIILTQAGALSANHDNFDDNNIAITATRYGQASTPGVEQDAGTLRCQAILTAAGYPPEQVYQQGGGIVCSQVWMAASAIGHATALTREAALPGLFNAGPVQVAYPLVDSVYAAPLKLTGGDSWWPIEYKRECTCWRILDPARQPSYPAA